MKLKDLFIPKTNHKFKYSPPKVETEKEVGILENKFAGFRDFKIQKTWDLANEKAIIEEVNDGDHVVAAAASLDLEIGMAREKCEKIEVLGDGSDNENRGKNEAEGFEEHQEEEEEEEEEETDGEENTGKKETQEEISDSFYDVVRNF